MGYNRDSDRFKKTERQNLHLSLTSLCVGGQGAAVIVER